MKVVDLYDTDELKNLIFVKSYLIFMAEMRKFRGLISFCLRKKESFY